MVQGRTVAATRLGPLEHTFEAIRAEAGVDERFPAAALAELGDTADREHAHVVDERVDATELPFATLDPSGARDLDQALHIEPDGGGHVVHYAIADVGAHVVPGGALDTETHRRVETVYCPDRRIGLHPPAMSEGYASLLPGQRTKAVWWTMQLDAGGELTGTEVRRAWVRSRQQYAYRSIVEDSSGNAKAFVARLAEVGEARAEVLRQAGAVTLPKPEQEVVVDGEHVTLSFRSGAPVEEHNAQVSLLTGMAAARMMLDAGVGVLRTMPPADPSAVARLRRQALALGVTWEAGWSYSDALERLDATTPPAAAFLVAATRLFRGAAWEPFDRTDAALPLPSQLLHGALAAPYAHVTAPLRRLVDRYGTEVCLAASAGRPVPTWVRDALPGLGATMAGGVRIASGVDRACINAVEAAMLAPHVGEQFSAVGLDDRTVQLAAPAVEARCDGPVAVGEPQMVALVSASLRDGPRFAVAS